jgi:dienelactone hydrolase
MAKSVVSLALPQELKDQVCFSLATHLHNKLLTVGSIGEEITGPPPKGKYTPKETVSDDKSPGTGPHPAALFTDPSLPRHTIYAPKSPPKDAKLPVLLFGNGGCGNIGSMFQNFLREIASHGFVVLANGPPLDPQSGIMGMASLIGKNGFQTKMTAMAESLKWAEDGAAGGKFGVPDLNKIAVAGQSCGGLEAYSASYREPRIKATVVLNSGVIDKEKRVWLSELKAPVALINGGPNDEAYPMVSDQS